MIKKNKNIIHKMGFKSIILIIAIFILVGGLIYTFYTLEDQVSKKEWPLTISKCPDYWTYNPGEDPIICKNEKKLGTNDQEKCPPEVCMEKFYYDSRLLAEDDCAKAQWARSCNLTWDGITNKQDICD